MCEQCNWVVSLSVFLCVSRSFYIIFFHSFVVRFLVVCARELERSDRWRCIFGLRANGNNVNKNVDRNILGIYQKSYICWSEEWKKTHTHIRSRGIRLKSQLLCCKHLQLDICEKKTTKKTTPNDDRWPNSHAFSEIQDAPIIILYRRYHLLFFPLGHSNEAIAMTVRAGEKCARYALQSLRFILNFVNSLHLANSRFHSPYLERAS